MNDFNKDLKAIFRTEDAKKVIDMYNRGLISIWEALRLIEQREKECV